MLKLVMAVGFFTVLIGVAVGISPERFLSLVDWPSREGLYVAAGIRVVVGILLLLAAPASRFPRVFRVIGVIALVAGLLMPFVPIRFWGDFMRWWIVDHLALFRILLAIGAILLGSFLAYAATPKRTAA